MFDRRELNMSAIPLVVELSRAHCWLHLTKANSTAIQDASKLSPFDSTNLVRSDRGYGECGLSFGLWCLVFGSGVWGVGIGVLGSGFFESGVSGSWGLGSVSGA